MKELTIKKNDANQRLDKYLKKLLCNASNSLIYKMIRKKDIKVNGKKGEEGTILNEGDVVSMFLYEDKFQELTATKDIYDLKITFDVLYEDHHLLVVNKPAGLLVHEDINESYNTLSHQVLSYLHQKGELDTSRESTFIPGPVHRLDRNTSGIVIFAKTFEASQNLNEMIKKRNYIKKSYLTIVKGKLTTRQELVGYIKKIENEARVQFVKKDDPQALMMKTIVMPRAYRNDFSLVEVELVTGRMHQIRIHLSSIDHPIIGDRKYGDFQTNKYVKKEFGLNHQLLHAYRIYFDDAIGCLKYLKGKTIECPTSGQFNSIRKKLIES